MKHYILRFLIAPLSFTVLTFAGCSGSDTSDTTRSNDSAAETTTSTTTAASGCCFSQESDFESFFPKGNDMIYPSSDKINTNFSCGDADDPKKSSANWSYQIDSVQYSGKMGYKDISLKIEDHSNGPADIQAKIERKKKTALESKNANVTVQELNSAGLYTGYSWVDVSKGNNASNILIEVVVDGRFYIQIMGVDHSRIELGMQLLEMIPLKDLAAKCK